MPTLARILVDYDPDLLNIVASLWDIDLQSSDRTYAVEELKTAILTPEAVDLTWSRLSDEQHQALEDLLNNGGQLSFSHFVRVYGDLRPMGPARREREKPWLSPVSITETLYYRGLITRTFEQTQAGVQEYIAIPTDLAQLLPEPRNKAELPGYAVAPPRSLKHGHITSPDDVATILAYLLLRETNAREWLQNTPNPIIDPFLRYPNEPAYRALLVQLSYDLGLIHDEKLLTHVVTYVNRDIARPWLEAPRSHQVRSLAETWFNSETWNDLAYTPGLETDKWPNAPLPTRQTIFSYLSRVPGEIWWSLDGFLEYMKDHHPEFQRPSGDYGSWYLRDVYTGEILHGFQYWDHIEGALLRFVIEKPLKWLGLAMAGQGAFYITQAGMALQQKASWASHPDPDARIRIDAQGLISVPVHIGRYQRVQITRFAAWISAPPPTPLNLQARNKDDGDYIYRLTPQAIQRAEDDGISLVSHVIPFLQRLSSHTIPANVLQMLESWHNDPREVIVHDVVIVTAKDLGVYERLRSNERVNKWMGQQIGPHAHIVKRENMPAVLNALRAMGILPLFEGHEKDDSPT